MNKKEKQWINEQLHKIWVIDNENDSQADDILEFLTELSRMSGYDSQELFKNVKTD